MASDDAQELAEVLESGELLGWFEADGTITADGRLVLTERECQQIANHFATKATQAPAKGTAETNTSPTNQTEQTTPTEALPDDAPLEAVIASFEPGVVVAAMDDFIDNPLAPLPEGDPLNALQDSVWAKAAKVCLEAGVLESQQAQFLNYMKRDGSLHAAVYGLISGSTAQLERSARDFAHRRRADRPK